MLPTTLTLPTGAILDCYVPDMVVEAPPRRSVVICPGGGYNHLSPREGEPVALRFVAMGFNAFVVKYRVSPHLYPAPLMDAAWAMAHVRRHAQEYHADPHKIALMGFSAGGHLAGLLGTTWHQANRFEPLRQEMIRPDVLVLCYPVITAGHFAHRGSFLCLTGSEDENAHQFFSVEDLVSTATPPTFLWHTWEDASVPVENTLLMAHALRAHGVPAEVHIFPRGGHGVGLGTEVTAMKPEQILPEVQIWPELVRDFLLRLDNESK